MAERWNGTSWSVERSSTPARATTSYLDGVSCSSASFCTAVGYPYDPYERNLAERWNATSWSVEPSSNPARATSSHLDGVSCSSATFCTAVGYYNDSAGEHQLVERWNGASWSVERSSNPARATSGYLNGVSCSSASFCTAVGYQYDPYEQNLAERWNGTLAPATVTGVSPRSGPAAGGTVVTIAGTGFTGASAVHFGTAAATNLTVNSATQISATSPSGTAGRTVDVTVIGRGGTSMTGSADRYSYLNTGPPPQETLTVTTGGTGSGTVTGSGISCPGTCAANYSQGTIVTLTATAAPGSTFGGWGAACSGVGVCTITIDAAEPVAATFTNTAIAGQADLATTLSSAGIATVGGYMGYTITVTNNGPHSASTVVATDSTPSGYPHPRTTFYCVGSVPRPGAGGWCGPLPSSVSCTQPSVRAAGTVSCTTTALLPGASLTVVMAVRSDSTCTIRASATRLPRTPTPSIPMPPQRCNGCSRVNWAIAAPIESALEVSNQVNPSRDGPSSGRQLAKIVRPEKGKMADACSQTKPCANRGRWFGGSCGLGASSRRNR